MPIKFFPVSALALLAMMGAVGPGLAEGRVLAQAEMPAPSEVPAAQPAVPAGEAPAGATPPATPPAATAPETPPAAAPAQPDPVPAPAAPAVAAPPPPASPDAIVTPPPEPIPVPGVLRGEAAMPEPVRATWRRLTEAARSGDIEKLRPIMEGQAQPPAVALAEIDDPLDYLRSLSGDAESREILAIMLEVLESGFVHVDEGTPQEMYIWPYFARYPLESLTPQQFVELFRLLTSADYQEMRSYGAYIFFRIGIAPDGTWRFFLAGD